MLFQSDLTPSVLVWFRLAGASFLLGGFLRLKKPSVLVIRMRELPWFVSLGVLGLALNFFCYYYAISKTQVAVAISLQYLAPLLIATFNGVVGREKFSITLVLHIVLAVLGSALVVEVQRVNVAAIDLWGVSGGLLAAVSFAWWSLDVEYLGRTRDPSTILFYGLTVAAVFWSFIALPSRADILRLTLYDWCGIAYVVVLGTIVPFFLMVAGMQRVGAARATIVATLEPVTAALVALVLVGESLSGSQIVGGVLVVGAAASVAVRGATVAAT